MIRTNDLMLGNWVEYATGLHKDKRSIPMQVTGIFSYTVHLNFEGNDGDVFEEEEENLLGIPITEEILEKCNMWKIASKAWKDDNILVYEDVTDSKYIVSRHGNTTKVCYLHQLQNAYFMLTGKQLEVRL